MKHHPSLLMGALLCILPMSASAFVYTIENSVANGGLDATGAWGNGLTLVSSVSDEDQLPGQFKYTYTFSGQSEGFEKAISHFVTGASATFGDANILGVLGLNIADYEVGAFGPGASNPNMPWNISNGIKYNTTGDPINFSFSLITDRAPILATGYIKDGKDKDGVFTTAWTTGGLLPDFTGNITDASQLEQGFILAPDSVPEPGVPFLGALGLLRLLTGRRRHC